MRIIDFHAHLDDHWLDQPLPDARTVLAGLDRCGVDAACVFTVMGLYGDCEAANERLAGQARMHPDRLIPFVTVDPKQGAAAVAEVERCLDDPLFRGVKLHPWLQAFAPSMVKQTVVDIVRVAARHQVPVVFHDGTPPYCTTFQVADVARWVPEAVVVAGHAGLADYVQAAGQLALELPNLHLCCCGPKTGDLSYLLECAGSDRVLFGSDFGVAAWPLLAERLDVVLGAGLDEDVLEQVLWRNAARLLKLPDA